MPASHSLMCIRITWGSCENAGSDSLVLGVEATICIFIPASSQAILMLLVHRAHFELQGLRVYLMQSFNVGMHMYLWHFAMALNYLL